MLSIITNTLGVASGDVGTSAFKNKYMTALTKFIGSGNVVMPQNIGSLKNDLLSASSSFLTAIVKYFCRYNELVRTENEDCLRNLRAVNEYKKGVLYKTTYYDKLSGNVCRIAEYLPKGDNRIMEFYAEKKTMKSVSFEKNGIPNDKMCFDEGGKITKYIRYNKEGMVSGVTIYDKDKTVLESYSNGILHTASIIYNSSGCRAELIYDDGEVISARENGKNYETYFVYENGKKARSGTCYCDNGVAMYKSVKYNREGLPKITYLYDADHRLCSKTEWIKDSVEIRTRYDKDGQVKSVEMADILAENSLYTNKRVDKVPV